MYSEKGACGDGDPNSISPIGQAYNIVYRFESSGRGYYLRICHPVLHQLPEALQVITDWHIKRDSFDHQRVAGLARDLWRGDPTSLRLIGCDYNIVYRFEAQGQGFPADIRICHSVLHALPSHGYRNPRAQVICASFLLAAENVPVGAPVAHQVNGELHRATGRAAIVRGWPPRRVEWRIPGQDLEQQRDLLDLSVYDSWGQV